MGMKNYKIYGLVFLLYTTFSFLSTEKIPHDGLGWDGNLYYVLACTVPDMVRDKTIDEYMVQRILPSFLVHYGLRIVDKSHRLAKVPFYERTPEVIVTCFMLLNGFCLILAAYYLLGIAQILDFSTRQKILLFAGVYASFFLLKQVFYYPALTDYAAFLIGTALLYYYLANHKIGLLLMLVLGAFTFANLIYCASILFLFPYQTEENENPKSSLANYLALFAAFAVMGFTAWLALVELKTTHYFSLFCVLFYLFVALKDSSEPLKWLQYFQKATFWKHFAMLLPVIFFVKFVQFLISNDQMGALTFLKALQLNIVETSIKHPLAFVPAHFMFFGFVFFIFVFYWKQAILEIRKLGIGFNILIYLYFFLLLGSESRSHVSMLPFFVLISVILLKDKLQHNLIFYSLLVVQLLVSKFWYPINTPEIYTARRTFETDLLEFPWQNWFMNSGYLVSETMYYVHFAIFVFVLAYFYLLKRRLKL